MIETMVADKEVCFEYPNFGIITMPLHSSMSISFLSTFLFLLSHFPFLGIIQHEAKAQLC